MQFDFPSLLGRAKQTRRAFLGTMLVASTMFFGSSPIWAENNIDPNAARWVTAFGTSQQPNIAVPLTINNATVRMVARVSIPGDAIRIRLDNTFGQAPVTIGSAFAGPRVQGARLAEGYNKPVTFNGSTQVVIPVGGSVMSDPVSLRVFARQDIGVSLYLPGTNVNPSQHAGAVVTSYLSANNSGDVGSDVTPTPFTATTTSMLLLKSVDVLSSTSQGAIVAFGDSITDGTCTTLDAHNRWEDLVSVRLDLGDENGKHPLLRDKAMVNEGIGGNTLTREGLQPPPDSTPGIERLDRDVLSHSSVTHVVLFMGTNDIRREASATQVIDAMKNIIARVKAKGLKILGATIIPRHNVAPSGTNTGWSPAKTAIRNEVNQWIRTSGQFDAVLDFDRVVRDPSNPDLIYPPFNCGDGIHPSPAGYYEMGKAVDLNLFKSPKR
jgi:lysophospholipase L1-like esterase